MIKHYLADDPRLHTAGVALRLPGMVLRQHLGDRRGVLGVLVVLRLGLYLYRRSKGIRDGYLDE
ncbi:hypothetical protein P4233_11525 [Pseudomonas aeruginosa]|nr:hypothetical protein [Pseudomonas aeruginosa]